MPKRNSKAEFFSLFGFLLAGALLLSNGFVARLHAAEETDVYRELEPVGVVLDTILREYVRDVEVEKVVEGALIGMMGSLDRNSSFISAADLEAMREDTKGEFEGIGVSIKQEEDGAIIVFHPIPNSPAAQAGIRAFDRILAVDGQSTKGMSTADAANLIKGRRGTTVTLSIGRKTENAPPDSPLEILEFKVRRDKVPLESIKEAQMLKGGIAYVRISDFKDNTGADLSKRLKEFTDAGAKGLVIDLRWNPGGLLSASKDVCELFLPKGSLVTYTRGRAGADGKANKDDQRLVTGRKPELPEGMPVIVLVNSQTASAAEIVTGALQFYERALVVGEKTFGKGSVQTIIPLSKPETTALRLTTALYYTPADVTIDHQGILPDVESGMTQEQEESLAKQMFDSFENSPENQYRQNHGSMTEYPAAEGTVEDLQLQRALDLLNEGAVWEETVKKYHRDVHETQMTAEEAEKRNGNGAPAETAEPESGAPETSAPDAAPEAAPEEAPDGDFTEPVW